MKSILTLVLFVLPMLAVCQSKSSIDVMIGGHSTYGYLNENSGLDPIIDSRNKNEICAFSWSTGLHFNGRLSERWYLRTGVLLTAMDYKSRKLTEFLWGDQVDTSFIYDPTIPTSDPLGVTSLQNIYQRRFIGIPIALRREFKSNKLTPFIEGGITPTFLLQVKRKFVTNINTRKFDDSYSAQHDFHLVGYITAGVQSSLSPGIQWFAQPIFRYHFTTTVDALIKERLFGIGMEVGVRKEMH